MRFGICLTCETVFQHGGNAKYCSTNCRVAAHRARHLIEMFRAIERAKEAAHVLASETANIK